MATIVTRAGKGSELTIAEADANIENLNNDKLDKNDGQIEPYSSVSSAAGTATLALDTANMFSITLTENTAFAITGLTLSAGQGYGCLVRVTQDGSNDYTLDWAGFGTVNFPGQVAPAPPAQGFTNIYSLYTEDGTNWWLGIYGENY